MRIETAEELLDWARLRKFIINHLRCTTEGLVKINTDAVVVNITSAKYGGYVVHTSAVKYHADIVVNALWYNIGRFNEILGVYHLWKEKAQPN